METINQYLFKSHLFLHSQTTNTTFYHLNLQAFFAVPDQKPHHRDCGFTPFIYIGTIWHILFVSIWFSPLQNYDQAIGILYGSF